MQAAQAAVPAAAPAAPPTTPAPAATSPRVPVRVLVTLRPDSTAPLAAVEAAVFAVLEKRCLAYADGPASRQRTGWLGVLRWGLVVGED